MAREMNFRLGPTTPSPRPLPIMREDADPRLRTLIEDLRANPMARSVELDYSFDSLDELQDPRSGLNPIVTRIIDEIRNQGFDPRVAGGHGKGSFSLTW